MTKKAGKEKKTFYDFIIIGAGAAGLSAGQYAARYGLDTLIIDSSGNGGQALNIIKLENYPGLFPPLTGQEYVQKMNKQAKLFGAAICHRVVSYIDKIGKEFVIETEDGTYRSSALLIATGAEHRELGVPGEGRLRGTGVSYCATCDGPFFKGKKIIVAGGGDSACDEALYLSSIASEVVLIHRRDHFRAQKAVVEKVKEQKNITIKYNSVISEIRGDQFVESVLVQNTETQETGEIAADAVFVFVGMAPRTELVSMLPRDNGGYLVTNENMETVIPGLYAAGDVRSKSFRQLVTAAADGAVAAHQAHEYITHFGAAKGGQQQ